MSETNLQRAMKRHGELATLDHALQAFVLEFAAKKRSAFDIPMLIGWFRDSANLVSRIRRIVVQYPELAASTSVRGYAEQLLVVADGFVDVARQYVAIVEHLERAYAAPSRGVHETLNAQKDSLRSGKVTLPSGEPLDAASALAKLDILDRFVLSVPIVEKLTGEPFVRLPAVVAAHRNIFAELVEQLRGPAPPLPS